MIKQSYPTKKQWHQQVRHLSARLAPYITEQGSLTAKLRATGAVFAVRPIQQKYAPCFRDNCYVLDLSGQDLVWQRDVILQLNAQPVVYAHTCIARPSLRGSWRQITQLGRKPLGELLFSTPAIMRSPLQYAQLDKRHPLYQRILAAGVQVSKQVWARRSCFIWQGKPLLVTEVFLPALEGFTHA